MRTISIFGFALSFGIIALLVREAGAIEIVGIIDGMDWMLFAIAISLYVVNSFLHTYRWKMFAEDMKIKAESAYFFIITWIGFAINSITPVAISGGEPAKIYYLSKVSGAKKSKTAATVAATDFMEIGSFIALDVVAAWIIYSRLDIHRGLFVPLLMTIALGTAVVGLILYMSLSRRASSKVVLFVTGILKRFRSLGKGIAEFEARIEHHLDIYESAVRKVSLRTVVVTLAMSAGIRIFDVLRLYLTVVALGEEIDPMFVVVANAFATAAAVVPLLPGSIGAMEPAMAAGLVLGGVSLPVATAVVIINRIAVLALDAIVGFPGIQHMGRIAGKYKIEGVE